MKAENFIEQWKPVKDYEGLYVVSNTGKVKNLKRNTELHPFNSSKGYKSVKLYNGDIKKTYKLHRLVGLAFISNPNNSPQINHIDCNKTNNNSWNLEWCTNQENQIHAVKNGLNHPNPLHGVDHQNSKFTEEQVLYICSLRGKMTQYKIAEMYGVNQSIISEIQTNKTYKNICR